MAGDDARRQELQRLQENDALREAYDQHVVSDFTQLLPKNPQRFKLLTGRKTDGGRGETGRAQKSPHHQDTTAHGRRRRAAAG